MPFTWGTGGGTEEKQAIRETFGDSVEEARRLLPFIYEGYSYIYTIGEVGEKESEERRGINPPEKVWSEGPETWLPMSAYRKPVCPPQ